MALALVTIAVSGLLFAPTVSAVSGTWVASDQPGDLWPIGENIGRFGYLDLLSAWVTVKSGTYTFGMVLAAPLTADTALPPGVKQISWSHALDYEPTWWPWGPNEGGAVIIWDGTTFRGVWVDIRPLLETGVAVETPLPFSIEGTHVTITVPARFVRSIGDLSTFDWWYNVHVWWSPPDQNAYGYWLVDVADNWPQPWPW